MNPANTLYYLKKPFKKFSHLKLTKKSKISDDLPDNSIESSHFSGQSSLIGLKGELETAVTQYLNQVTELGYYKGPRESNSCKFTTFKAPTLPKKTGKKPTAPKPPVVPSTVIAFAPVDDQLLDVKFQLITETPKIEEATLEEGSSIESQALDNPIYLSLSECSSASQKETFEPVYENSYVPNSDDEDHIYENVDSDPFHLYDTVTNPPRPKLPPKPSNSKDKSDKSKEKVSNIHDGSETSDLGSSGSEDINSEEDWPLPPTPVITELTASDIPLPPPPPELALQKLEEEVLKEEEEENRQTLLRNKNKTHPIEIKSTFDKVEIKKKEVIYSELAKKPADSNIQSIHEDSLLQADLREENPISKAKEISEVNEEEDFPSIRHSVIIELKDSLQQQSLKDIICEDQTPINTQVNGSVCVNVKQKIQNRENCSFIDTTSSNEQVIEISDDGSWAMKGTEENSQNSSSGSTEIDRFTGQPIMASLVAPVDNLEIIPTFEVQREESEPNIYFEEPSTLDVSFENTDGMYSASCIETNSKDNSLVIPENNSTITPLLNSDDVTSNISEISKTVNVCKQNSNSSSNLGAAIMEGYERDLQKKKDNLNLPEVSLLEFGDDVKELEIQRRSVIELMTVKVKKKDSWIRTFRSPSDPSIDTLVIKNSEKNETVSDESTEKISEITTSSTEEAAICKTTNFSQFLGKTVKLALNAKPAQIKKVDDCDATIAKKSEISKKDNQEGFLGKCFKNPQKVDEINEQKPISQEVIEEPVLKKKGEVDDCSILDKKEETKSYWEAKMLGADDSGWEPVANVRFQVNVINNEESSVPPPPQFSVDDELPQYENLVTTEDSLEGFVPQEKVNPRPTRQYMYGVSEQPPQVKCVSTLVVREMSSKTSKENVIEAEIREQQLKEEALRKQLRNRDKGATSPSSHVSDEGFVDRTPEEVPSPPSSQKGGFTHTLSGANGEHIIYDAVNPPSEFFTESGDSETKIALEIRELKEREAELRAIREMREREQQLRSILPASRVDEGDEEVERASSSSRDTVDDRLMSLTTTTDEGNFSEYGDPTSSEDKSSNGSNSRIMSPDLVSYNHPETRQRKVVTVKPFEDDDNTEEQQPVYMRMKNESVIEREIRLSKERDEAFRREKGLPATTSSENKTSKSSISVNLSTQIKDAAPSTATEETPKRGAQHRMATKRIQQEIEETCLRERELQTGGQIKTLSEDTVDSKLTRISDFNSVTSKQPQLNRHHSNPVGSITPTHISPSSPTSSPYNPPAFTPSPSKRPPAPIRLTRSFSTNNLSIGGGSLDTTNNALRVPQKGLMQKFFASRGKITGTTFVASSSTMPSKKSSKMTANGISTRPMRVMPKAPVVRMEVESKSANEAPKIYKRTQVTAEEKIQEELRDMKQREEELRRLRARNLARSQPNLAGLGEDDNDEDGIYSEGVDSSSFLHEMNGLRSALSNPNLLEDEEIVPQQTQATDKSVRRRSALIAQWEGRIQQISET